MDDCFFFFFEFSLLIFWYVTCTTVSRMWEHVLSNEYAEKKIMHYHRLRLFFMYLIPYRNERARERKRRWEAKEKNQVKSVMKRLILCVCVRIHWFSVVVVCRTRKYNYHMCFIYFYVTVFISYYSI